MKSIKNELYSFFLEDPIGDKIERKLNNTRLSYFYFNDDLNLKTNRGELLNGCLLSGTAVLEHDGKAHELNQFDFFFLPPEKELQINIAADTAKNYKICLFYYDIDEDVSAKFEIQHFNLDKFIPRGENGSEKKMATYRTVWTAIKNGYFMSGFTNIPTESLKQGVITSVNLESNQQGDIEIYPHIHPEYPEVYIMCIDDEKYAISQYLINTEGESVCQDLSDGEGLFFPGNLGHSNFSRPFYKNLRYCMYLWIIPTFDKVETVSPITLRT